MAPGYSMCGPMVISMSCATFHSRKHQKIYELTIIFLFLYTDSTGTLRIGLLSAGAGEGWGRE